jgi:hypothetical protein
VRIGAVTCALVLARVRRMPDGPPDDPEFVAWIST